MGNITHTLTAYHITFSYLRKNNPLKDELNQLIKNNATPVVSVKEILQELIMLTSELHYDDLIVGSKIITFNQIEDEEIVNNGFTRLFIRPNAGKIDVPIRIINLKDKEKNYNFKKDWASTYQNNVFIYEKNNEYYFVCHRQGGSGCKTLILSIFNKILKKQGIKMNMNFMPPLMNNENDNHQIDKISLLYEENLSSDIADIPNRKTKKKVVKELTLNLNNGNKEINKIMQKYSLREISKEEAFNEISKEEGVEGYNNATVLIKIGNTHKKVSWDDFEKLIAEFDITDKLANSGDHFIAKLKECSDEFLNTLIVDKVLCG